MRSYFKQIGKTYIGVFIISAILCTNVGAQGVCCNEDLYSCNLSARLDGSMDIATIALSESRCHKSGNLLQQKSCSDEKIFKVAPGTNCCDVDCCEDYNKASYIQLSLVQVDNSSQLMKPSTILSKGIEKKFDANIQPKITLSIPIYLLTQSLLC